MNNEELKTQVKYLREVEKLSTPQIAATLGISRGRCLRILSGKHGDRIGKQFCLEPYRSLVGQWYAAHPSLKASQVFERLRSRGIETSYTSVKRLTRSFRVKRPRSYFPLTFAPGEEAQVDWFVVKHPALGTLSGFAFILSYSRFLYARIFPRLSFEFFIEGHLGAFSAVGGRPRALRYDNLRSVVLRRHPTLSYNPAFLEFARHYGFEIRLCNIRAGNEKGRVERAIRTIRETFLNTQDRHHSLRALNIALQAWLGEKNHAPHRTTGKPPVLLLAEEKLQPLPQNLWLNRAVYPPKLPTKTGLMLFDTNQYSVPEYLVGSPLIIHAFCDKLEVYDQKGNRVAAHPRAFDRGKTILNPQHRTFARIGVKTKIDRIYAVVKNLDPAVDKFLALNEQIGEDPRHTAYALFRLLGRHSRNTILSAIREAITTRAPRLQFLSSRLAVNQPSAAQETVRPRQIELLDITYTPRSLEEYQSHDQ